MAALTFDNILDGGIIKLRTNFWAAVLSLDTLHPIQTQSFQFEASCHVPDKYIYENE